MQCQKVKKCLITGKINDHFHCNILPQDLTTTRFKGNVFSFLLLAQPQSKYSLDRTSSARHRSRMVTGCPFSVCDAPSCFFSQPNAQDNTPPVALFPISLCMSEIKNESMISLSGKLTLILEAARFCVLYNCLSDSARCFPGYSTEESNLSERRVC